MARSTSIEHRYKNHSLIISWYLSTVVMITVFIFQTMFLRFSLKKHAFIEVSLWGETCYRLRRSEDKYAFTYSTSEYNTVRYGAVRYGMVRFLRYGKLQYAMVLTILFVPYFL